MNVKIDPEGFKVRELILTALFRPAAKGVVKDDGTRSRKTLSSSTASMAIRNTRGHPLTRHVTHIFQ